MNLRRGHSFWIGCLFLTAVTQAGVQSVQGQGTIQFLNSALSRIQYRECRLSENSILINAPAGVRISIEIGPSPFQLQEVGFPVSTTGDGLFYGGVVYPVPGTSEGQTVWMRVVGRHPNGTLGTTEVLPITLGPTAGPGTVIFQSATGTATNRFRPFIVQPLSPCAGDTIVFASRLREVVFTQAASDVFAVFRATYYLPPGVPQARIDFTTVDGTAVAGVDYLPTSGTLFFDAATPTKDLAVRVLQPPIPKNNRYFFLRFSNASPTAQLPITLIQWIADPFISSVRREPLSTQISMPRWITHAASLALSPSR